jgi:uncharacterized membrane protein
MQSVIGPSVIGKAKRSVDSTLDAFFGRVAFAASVLGAVGFALAGTWIVLVEHYGTIVACFGIAAILVLVSLAVHMTVAASEASANHDLKDVEKSIGESQAAAFPFDIATVVTVLPMLLPLIRSLRIFLPFLIVAGVVASYVISTKSAEQSAEEPAPSQP